VADLAFSNRARVIIAVTLAIIAAFSIVQVSGLGPGLAFADSSLTAQLHRVTSSSESLSANATIVVNLVNGQTEVRLTNATQKTSYIAVFLTTSNLTLQLGTLVTGSDGNADSVFAVEVGAYTGLFEIARAGIVPNQLGPIEFSSLQENFVIGSSDAAVTTSTNSEITIENTQLSAGNSTQTVFQVTPSAQFIVAGDYAKFNIDINRAGSTNVLLVARGVPVHSNAIFAPQVGVANPQFHSTLAIVTSIDTPATTYNITVVALLNGQEYTTNVSLQLTPNASSTQTSTISSASLSLSLGVDTDSHFYDPNGTVIVRGHVTDASGGAIAGASVLVQVDEPSGAELVLVNNLTTDDAGIYHTELKLGANAMIGTYTVFVSSAKPGYTGATIHTTFVVGSSITPSVVISQVYVTNTTGNPSGVFSAGQTVLVWVILQNNGAPFQGVIWVQILDPNGTPQSIQLQISTLPTGASVKVAFGFTASINLPHGIYSANALVSDKLISQGGTFLASAKTQFALTG
jgi:hypothetical protein